MGFFNRRMLKFLICRRRRRGRHPRTTQPHSTQPRSTQPCSRYYAFLVYLPKGYILSRCSTSEMREYRRAGKDANGVIIHHLRPQPNHNLSPIDNPYKYFSTDDDQLKKAILDNWHSITPKKEKAKEKQERSFVFLDREINKHATQMPEFETALSYVEFCLTLFRNLNILPKLKAIRENTAIVNQDEMSQTWYGVNGAHFGTEERHWLLETR